jgi:hypothetical protein
MKLVPEGSSITNLNLVLPSIASSIFSHPPSQIPPTLSLTISSSPLTVVKLPWEADAGSISTPNSGMFTEANADL